jgi:AbrB family looped-hinge helix DNA binding protein
MSEAATTTLSSKGQVVIPEEIRVRLGLRAGTQFVVVADRDVVIFKVLDPPALSEFASLVARARQVAKRAGLRPADVVKAVSKVRRAR